MRSGKKLLPEEKYNLAYANPEYMRVSVGQAYLTWVLTHLQFKTVLDVGCGVGYSILNLLLHHKAVQGIEICDYLINGTLRTYACAGVVKKGRIQEIPHPADTFDLVYCTDVLEHIPEPDIHKSIGELVRVSKKYIFVSICTIPSQCMPELKLHETIKQREWWEAEFNKFRVKMIGEPLVVQKDAQYQVRKSDGFAAVYKKY